MSDDLMIVHDSADDLETTAIAVRGNASVQHTTDKPSPMDLIRFAIQSKTPAAELTQLVELAEKMTEREARMEFNRELAAFRAECPKIKQGRTASIATSSGGSYSFTYAELDEITRIVDPILVKRGFSYRWSSETNDKGQLTSTFILTHVNGHSERTPFSLPTENKSGMSPQQKIGAADSFAKRKALCNGLGIVTTDNEESASDRADREAAPIAEDQARELVDLITETKSSMKRLLAFYGIESIDKLPAPKFAELKRQLLERKAEKETLK